MSETSAPKAAKGAAKASKAFDAPFEAFKFAVPAMEVPAAFRDFAEKSVADARDAYAKLKTAAEEATDAIEDSYETARSGFATFGHKAVDAAKANTDAAFDLAKDLLSVKTFAEAFELQSAFARKQFESLTSQAKDFQEFAQKLTADASKPVKETVEKAFKDYKIN